MKKIAILSTNEIANDPRITRVFESSKRKYQIDAFCFVWPYTGQKLIEKKKNLIIRRFQYQKMAPAKISKAIVLKQEKDVEKKSSKNDFLYRLIGRITYLYNYYYANRKLADEAIKSKPSLVYANDLDTLLAGWWIKKRTAAKLIYDSHEIWTEQGQDLPGWVLKLYKLIEKRLLAKVDALISVNQSIVNELTKTYKIKRTYPKIILYNCPKFLKIEKIDWFDSFRKNHPFVLFYHGGYMPGRGLEELIMAMKDVDDKAILLLRIPNLAGNNKLQEIIDKNNLNERVKIIEPVQMKDMIAKSIGADVGIIPYKPINLNNKYSTPNKLFEYMMAGMAIASSDLVEIKRIIKVYRNGVVFNPSKPENIARAINDLIKGRNLSKLKENSLAASKIFSWQNEEKKLFKLYAQLLASKS